MGAFPCRPVQPEIGETSSFHERARDHQGEHESGCPDNVAERCAQQRAWAGTDQHDQ
jgi:hypothetical protein